MAFENTDIGISVAAAYVKIGTYTGDKNHVTFDVQIYSSVDLRNAEKSPMGTRSYKIEAPAAAILPALYNHLKTLPEFAGALDV